MKGFVDWRKTLQVGIESFVILGKQVMLKRDLGTKRKRDEAEPQEAALKLSAPEKALAKADPVYAEIICGEAEKAHHMRKTKQEAQQLLDDLKAMPRRSAA